MTPSRTSTRSLRSLASSFSIQSFGSTLSIKSIGSFASILSIGSAGSILSIGSAGSILSIRSEGRILCKDNQPLGGLDDGPRAAAGGLAAVVALATAGRLTVAVFGRLLATR